MDLDQILGELGEFGNYQITVYILLFFPLVFSAMGSLSYVFTAGDIEYRCKVPECERNITIYEEPWLFSALPNKKGKLTSHCKRFKSVNNTYHENCTKNFFSLEIEDCHSFVFKNEENTITKEFNLWCEENDWKRTLVGTLNSIGQFIGMPLAGMFSDRFGRKTMITTALLSSSLMGTLKSFSNNYIQFVIFEILDAIVSAGIYAGIFILGIEFTGCSKRALGGVILSSYYSVGEVILGLIVWFVDDWRIYLRILYIPGFIVIIYYWIMPESVRWLLTHGQKEKVVETLNKLAIQNKKPMSEDIKKAIELLEKAENMESEESKNSSDKNVSEYPMKAVLKSRVMLLRILNCSFCWITNTFVFYGLSLSSVAIAGNKYINFILVSFIEIPAYIITWLVIDNFGRKLSLSMSLVISGISCTMFHFLDADMQLIKLILFLIGKCAITVSFTALYVCASELFPTNMRHSLMGLCSTIGRFGSMIAPQMPLLAAYVDPVLIFGAVSFVAGALALYFPETLHSKLPDTIEEAEVIGKELENETS